MWQSVLPVLQSSQNKFPDEQEIKSFNMPLSYEEHVGETIVMLKLKLGKIRFNNYEFIQDDCLEELRVNDKVVNSDQIPFCAFDSSITFDLSDYLVSDVNTIFVRLSNAGGPASLHMIPSRADPLFLILFAIAGAILFLFVYRVLSIFERGKRYIYIIGFCIVLAVGIRFLYILGTPFDVRSNDVTGHFDYISFLLQHHRLPAIGEGWQWYQPPLYYVMLCPIVSFLKNIGMTEYLIQSYLQWGSFLISIITFFVLFLVSKQLFTRYKERHEQLLFVVILAVFPGLIYFSASVNNDVLLLLLEVLSLLFLLNWWQSGARKAWYIAIICMCLALLTKSNALLLIPVAFGCLIFAKHISNKEKIYLFFVGLILFLILTAWLPIYRLISSQNASLVGNIESLNGDLLLQNTVRHLIVFNPLSVIKYPFADAWSDLLRRQYFWEYLYRSAFFAEFIPPDYLHLLSTLIVSVNLFTIPFLIWGVIYGIWKRIRNAFPMLLLLISLLFGHLAFRIFYPYSSSQNFRYSILLLIPVIFFTLVGAQNSHPIIRFIGKTALWIFALFCLVYLVCLSIN